MSALGNMALTATNSAMTSAMGALFDKLQAGIANGGRDRNCKFYYSGPGAGGSILQVAAKAVVGGAVSTVKDWADGKIDSLLNGKKKDKDIDGLDWVSAEIRKNKEESERYGKMEVDGGSVLALDDWGCVSPDALMLGIELDKPITIRQLYPVYGSQLDPKTGIYKEKQPKRELNSFSSKTLVWYDTTALITVNSDKNMVVTRVQGRDYSRKELVSNGDIKFSVSGQITSGKPDIYPTEEIKKFIKVMQYKGIVKVTNQVLDQFGITHIVITDFNISPREGYKSIQNYTFSAIGLQPEKEVEIKYDTVEIIMQKKVESKEDDGSEWLKMLNNQLDGLKSMAGDLFSQGTALASGMLDNAL